jgi:hypothetical protein
LLSEGDFVAFHWETAAAKLDEKGLRNLVKCTERSLNAFNSMH